MKPLRRPLSPTFPAGAMVFFIPSRGGGRRRFGRGASRPARAAWLVQRLLTADGDVAGGAGFRFGVIRVAADVGARAIAAAPLNYRVIAELRHRKRGAIGLYVLLSLRHFRLARSWSLSLGAGAPRRARRIEGNEGDCRAVALAQALPTKEPASKGRLRISNGTRSDSIIMQSGRGSFDVNVFSIHPPSVTFVGFTEAVAGILDF